MLKSSHLSLVLFLCLTALDCAGRSKKTFADPATKA
jgi:hypothetical protein